MKTQNTQLKLPSYLFNQITLLAIVMLLLVVVITSFSPQFLTWHNIRNLLMQNAITGIVAAGMTLSYDFRRY